MGGEREQKAQKELMPVNISLDGRKQQQWQREAQRDENHIFMAECNCRIKRIIIFSSFLLSTSIKKHGFNFELIRATLRGECLLKNSLFQSELEKLQNIIKVTFVSKYKQKVVAAKY